MDDKQMLSMLGIDKNPDVKKISKDEFNSDIFNAVLNVSDSDVLETLYELQQSFDMDDGDFASLLSNDVKSLIARKLQSTNLLK